MDQNFLPPQPLSVQSDRWRNVTILFIIGLTVLGGVGFELIARLSPEHQQILVAKSQEFIGGDITVPPPHVPKPQLPLLEGLPFDVSTLTAQAMIVKDVETGTVLLEKNAYEARPIASITKLMSALVILEKDIDWEAEVTVIGADALGTHMYAGDTYTFQELWNAALVGSSNKAIKSLANALGWPEEAFVERMNQKARELGMSHTQFTDTTGLDATDMASVSDIAILLDEALRKEEIRKALNLSEVDLYSVERKKGHHMYNTNWLLLGWVPHQFHGLLGGKTGYTPEAGYNFSMQVEDELGHRLNVVVLGTDSHEARFTEARDVAAWAFDAYRWPDEPSLDVPAQE